MTPEMAHRDIVLIVDDMPTNLHLLSTALDQAGLVALVALDGFMALEQLKLVKPGMILLDALMPGMDGFELCRRLQSNPETRDIPVIFMTALNDTDHMVRGFTDGAVDYVVKPIRPTEVVARISAHLRRSRYARQARSAMECMGVAAAAVREDGEILWLTDPARHVLRCYFAPPEDMRADPTHLPPPLDDWVKIGLKHPSGTHEPFRLSRDGQTLTATLKVDPPGAVLVLSTETRDWPTTSVREQFRLTARESEILMWVAYGKTNRQIGQILEISPRTVNKHLDHIFLKLGVETRAAATAIAIRSTPQQTDASRAL